jgi:hypothetical protein
MPRRMRFGKICILEIRWKLTRNVEIFETEFAPRLASRFQVELSHTHLVA